MVARAVIAFVLVLGISAGVQVRTAGAESRLPSAAHAVYDGTAAVSRPVPGGLREAIRREAVRSAGRLPRVPIGTTQPSAPAPERRKPWIRRHPVLFGALVGAAAGTLSAMPRWTELYCAFGGDEDCLFHGASGVGFGAGAGAGIGALIGVGAR